jgi:hypothetical protein
MRQARVTPELLGKIAIVPWKINGNAIFGRERFL